MNNPQIIVKNAPFKHFCMSIGAIPTSYLDSLDYYETLLWLIKYLEETIIPTVNNNGEAVAELQNLYIELKNYVVNYFANLDVQEEINNKLDEMVEDGTLQEIIGEYLNANALWCFDTVEDMKSADNLIDGSYAQTLGYNAKNDGGKSLYKIRTKLESELIDNFNIIDIGNELIAELIYNNSYIIEEIRHITYYNENSKSNIELFFIPNKDNENNLIKLKHGFSNDVVNNTIANETPSSFSARKNATFCCNGGIFNINQSSTENLPNNMIQGLIIHNGEVVTDNRNVFTDSWLRKRYILGIKEDNTLTYYLGNTSAQSIINDGVKETIFAFHPIMLNGNSCRNDLTTEALTDWSEPQYSETSDLTPNYNKIYFTANNGIYTGHMYLSNFDVGETYYEQTNNRNACQTIFQNEDNDILVITTTGRGKTENLGVTPEEIITIAQYYNYTFGFLLDGGGSADSVYINEKMLQSLDDKNSYSAMTNGQGKTERNVADFIYFSKEIYNSNNYYINNIYKKMNELKKQIENLEMMAESILTQNNGTIRMYGSETSHTNGISFWRQKEDSTFEQRIAIILDQLDNFPLGLAIRDSKNEKNLLRIYNTDGIEYLSKKIALLKESAEYPTEQNQYNLNAFDKTRIDLFSASWNLTNQPFTSSETTLYLIFQIKSGNLGVQIAFSYASDFIIKVRVKYGASAISSWKTITLS